MSVARIIEISADSQESFGDAIRQGIARAERSVEHGTIVRFRVDLEVTFVLDD